MKKYFGLLCCAFALNACDDGDMVFDSFNFEDARSADCGLDNPINTVFKINDNEALILKIDGSQTFFDQQGNPYLIDLFPFRNQMTVQNDPKIYTISNDNKVIYRVFNGTVTSGYFCSQIPPTSPSVVDESTTLGTGSGTIEISTSIIPAAYATLSAVKYQHSVMLKNITFINSQGTTTYEQFYYGIYERNSNVSFAFSPTTDPIQKCSDGKLIRFHDRNVGDDPTKEDLNEVLEFTITDGQLNSLDVGESVLYTSDTNKLTYKIFSNDVDKDYVCAGTVGNLNPLPMLYDQFASENGTPAVGETPATGKITITKTPIPTTTTFKYSFLFSNVKFKDADGTTTFIQNTHLFGDYIF